MDAQTTQHVTELGNRTALFALKQMRQQALEAHLLGARFTDLMHGFVLGQLLVAKYDMRADPLVMLAVNNEVAFLQRQLR